MISWAFGASFAISSIKRLSSLKVPRALSLFGNFDLLFIGYSKFTSPYKIWASSVTRNSKNLVAVSLFFENFTTPPPEIFTWAPLSPGPWFGKTIIDAFAHLRWSGFLEYVNLP